MFKLVKNKVPEELKAKGEICDYATINTKELFLAYVRATLADSLNGYFETDNLENLVDVKILLDTLIKEIGQEEFDKVYADTIRAHGDYSDKVILFAPDK